MGHKMPAAGGFPGEGVAELVHEIRIAQVLDCMADPDKIRVVAELSCDITAVLPYLATLLPRAGYNGEAAILSMVREGRLITVYPRLVTLAKALDEDDARAILEWLRATINEAHARRGELKPCEGRRHLPRVLDIYRLLPGGNCRRCGEATCMAFAARLVVGEIQLRACPRLAEEGYTRNRSLLAEWLGEGPE